LNYFLDTNICVYCLNGKEPSVAKNLLLHTPHEIKIPSVVAAELIYGAKKSANSLMNISKLKIFLRPFEIVPFDENAAECYGDVRTFLERSGKIISGNDMMIAATVLSRDGVLVTNNVKEFIRVGKLTLKNWVE
jgi:tRNA(fMet)-specific endonuclease VapC